MVTKKNIRQQETLTAAYKDYAKGMNSYSFYKINNHATSDDLVQNTFLKTWKYLIKDGKIEIMKAFLYHILNQLIIDEYRKRKTVSLDVLLEKGYTQSTDPTKRIFNVFDGKAAVLLIKQLPKKYQIIIKMRYIQDLSIKEISVITGQSKNTVTVQAHRGLEKLKILYHNR
ncbi:hypothetical protein COW81_02180 [Candidatus Campbellbacteria bacterium CG22_combo_CG10-13_8_21_14_all_36_13]|uniref:RNA polymerase sigma factor n=1 Tax=Candidatus Campbellbacteria bacterium CG22_combo_CG10-13_8_21_14_all_36_13 TaxID=1974529 RepID=A0A2H0DY26_9BACT|nr:MAG: hypothetical protein COW81_02180 [Candidatus Campbellbacteria bacterium CG22_combo_CG10-13_8_21_14_all_36_13]